MAISEIHHVALTVSDLKKSIAFYKKEGFAAG
jgi:catechol 2,3-dioxygenase-like lactoylglutathione lyase family enzyme